MYVLVCTSLLRSIHENCGNIAVDVVRSVYSKHFFLPLHKLCSPSAANCHCHHRYRRQQHHQRLNTGKTSVIICNMVFFHCCCCCCCVVFPKWEERKTHRAIIKYLNEISSSYLFNTKETQRSLQIAHNAPECSIQHMSCIAHHNTSPDSKIKEKKTIASKMRAYSDSDILYQHISGAAFGMPLFFIFRFSAM